MPERPNTLDSIKVDYFDVHGEKRTTTYKEFIKLDPKTLEPSNLELLKVMQELYALNDREPPLYKSFPNKPDKPLTIDATSILEVFFNGGEKGASASFNPKRNVVCFEKVQEDFLLLDSLAHELKHAEQHSQELEEMQQTDGLSYHQINYLKESQAYAFGDYVATLSLLNRGWSFDKISETFPRIGGVLDETVKDGKLDRADYEKEGMSFHLSRLLGKEGESYRRRFHGIRSIKNKDAGISQIPESLNLTDKAFQKEFLEKLRKIPRKAEEPGARLLQLLSDNHKIAAFTYSLENMMKYKRADKQKRGQSVLDSASIMLVTRMYNGTINSDEFEKTLKFLRRMGVNMKNEEVYDAFTLLASVNKETFSILSGKNIINKDNIGGVLKKASLKNNVEVIKPILEKIRNDLGIKKETKKEIFQDALWTATRKEHVDVIKEILKECKEAKISMKDILTLDGPLLLMSLTMDKRAKALDVILTECQKEGCLKDVLNAKDDGGKTILSYINRYGLSDICKKYSNLPEKEKTVSQNTLPSKNNSINQYAVHAAIQQKRMNLK